MDNKIEKTIADFRAEIEGFTLEQLEKKAEDLRNDISKMILDSDLIIKASIVDTKIKELKKELN